MYHTLIFQIGYKLKGYLIHRVSYIFPSLLDNSFWKTKFSLKYGIIIESDQSELEYRILEYLSIEKRTKYLIVKGDIKIFLRFAKEAYLTNPVLLTALYGNLEMLKALHNEAYNLHIKQDKVFIYATKGSHLEIMEYLISKGANLHTKNDKPAKIAAKNNNISILDFLFNRGVNVNTQKGSLLMIAVTKGNLNLVTYLINKGVDIIKYGKQALIYCIIHGHMEIFNLLVSKGVDVRTNNDDLFYHAIHNNRYEVIESLLYNDMSIHKPNDYLLDISISSGSLEMTKFFIEKGVCYMDLDVENIYHINIRRYIRKLQSKYRKYNQ